LVVRTDITAVMGCTSSSLRSPASKRDDLQPQPHPYTEGEVRRSNGFTRSFSGGGVTKSATATTETHQYQDAGAGAVSYGHTGGKKAEAEGPEKPRVKTRKELREEGKRRMAGRRPEQSGAAIANMAWT
jgi:hypothetical protein